MPHRGDSKEWLESPRPCFSPPTGLVLVERDLGTKARLPAENQATLGREAHPLPSKVTVLAPSWEGCGPSSGESGGFSEKAKHMKIRNNYKLHMTMGEIRA